ncbi:hypothetical protein DM01DRAFT_1032420 [Hesseltinella vesiculosa]|uniref:DUF3020 domain-containing protein n=1 Tax=Hesseltinella vesiculosa TaxID=101127 RepID=A0A1X2GJK8_9FUNG|nr:hypothetical protein DM01DRAFT_1032420 [Hesseltinella vesiculosa]
MVDAAAAKKELAMPVNCQKPSSPPSSVHSPTETNHDNTAPVLAPNLNSQAYQQQLHDAMMALECSGMSANLMAAAAAAMAAAAAGVAVDQIASPVSDTQESASSSSTVTDTDARSPSTATSTEPSQSTSTPITEKPSIPGPLSASSEADLKHTKVKKELDQAKRDSIRTANRERKKKWRLHNEERNKDNDLRCRVNKRATKLFGPENTETKRNWAEEEFNKRREKRQEKERRKDVVNNVLSVPQSSSTKQPLTKPDPATPQESPTADDFNLPPVFDASKILEIPQELQRHLLEQLNIASG